MASEQRVKRWPRCLVVAALVLVVAGGCSANNDDDIIVLSLPPTRVATADQSNDAGSTSGTGSTSDAGSTSDTGTKSDTGSGDAFVTEAVAEANQAEQNHVPTPTPTLIPRTPSPTATRPSQTRPTPTAPPAATKVDTPTVATPAPTSSSQSAATTNTTGSVNGWERPASCSDGYERVYEAFATDSPAIGIAICVAPDGRAEYLGLDVATSDRIRLAACVDGADFVANNAGSVYVVDIGQDTIRYPQAPSGRRLDAVTMITSATTIPALGC